MEPFYIEDIPDSVVATMELRDRSLRELATSENARAFVVQDASGWVPGQKVTVAFKGGDVRLHRDIESAVQQISDNCNLSFDFGKDAATGLYRTWSTDDTEYAADIRVSFDMGGYWSLVGNDSVNSFIGLPSEASGGRPYQRSLNLGGFDLQRPTTWLGTTRHEFMHAVGFHHEHQSPGGTCEDEFRWENDAGYQPTVDNLGQFINDKNGRRPGIYTYLAGHPNGWSRQKVDHNLRRLDQEHQVSFGAFDRSSIMLYRFPSLFYKSSPSPCAPLGDGQELSSGDRAGLLQLYPYEQEPAKAIVARRQEFFDESLSRLNENAVLKSPLQKQRRLVWNRLTIS